MTSKWNKNANRPSEPEKAQRDLAVETLFHLSAQQRYYLLYASQQLKLRVRENFLLLGLSVLMVSLATYKTLPVEIALPLTVTSVINPATKRHTRLSATIPRNVYLTYRSSMYDHS